jgi:4-hydroxy-tetrahydrodipicolinate synthase
MTSDLDLRGVWVPLITPFTADDKVDREAIERLCREYLAAGAVGIVALGTTAEAAALEKDEKQAVVETVTRVCAEAGRRVIVGTGSYNTRHTIEDTNALAGLPAVVGALVVVPYYVRPSEAGIVAHFKAVAAVSPVPIVLYNVPYRTGRSMGADAILELASTPNVAGIKQAVGALDADTLRVLEEAPSGFGVLGGEDIILFQIAALGGVGAIAASAHACTERVVEMIECGIAGKLDDGRAHAAALLPVVEAGFAEPNPAVWKGVLHAQGRIATPNLRLPMTNASAAAIDRCLDAIARASGS